MRIAVPLILQEDLATSRILIASAANSESSAYQLGATEVLRATVESRKGRINIEAVVTDLSTQRNRRVIRAQGASSTGFLPTLNALAKTIDERAGDFSTKNVRAAQAFSAAAETSNSQSRVQMLDEAISVDPGFGLGYIALAETIAQTREQNLPALLRTASLHSDSFTRLDQARFNALRARLSQAPMKEQENAYAAVLQLAPNNTDALAAVGADRFLEGDGTSGARFLERALEINPGNANIRNQLAVGLLETRRFADAEKIFAGLPSNTSALPELAVCILLEGDEARADAVANRFADSLNPDARQAYRATWLALSGRLAKAINAMQSFHDQAGGPLQIAIWQLMQKDLAGAKKNAFLAAQLAKGNESLAAVATLLSKAEQPPEQWREEVKAAALNDSAKQALLGYGFFLYEHFPEASAVWQTLVEQSGGANPRTRTMLAASLNRAGKTEEARKILVQPFVPEFGDLYAAVAFTEMRRLLNLQGK